MTMHVMESLGVSGAPTLASPGHTSGGWLAKTRSAFDCLVRVGIFFSFSRKTADDSMILSSAGPKRSRPDQKNTPASCSRLLDRPPTKSLTGLQSGGTRGYGCAT